MRARAGGWLGAIAALSISLVGCRIPNEDHCGRREGDATCSQRDPGRPYCDLCEAENDGCVAVLDQITSECRAGNSERADESAGETSTPGTETATETEAGTGTETTETTDTTGMETETGETGTPAVCGNGVVEGDEDCDGDDFGGATCSNPYGLPEGSLVCVPGACLISTSECCLANGEVCEPGECCNANCNAITNKCGL